MLVSSDHASDSHVNIQTYMVYIYVRIRMYFQLVTTKRFQLNFQRMNQFQNTIS